MQNAETYNFCIWVKSSKNGRKMVENQFLRFFGKKIMIFHNFSSQIIWKILILLHQFKEEKILRKMVQTRSLHPPANLRFALPTPANPKTANIVYREVLSQ